MQCNFFDKYYAGTGWFWKPFCSRFFFLVFNLIYGFLGFVWFGFLFGLGFQRFFCKHFYLKLYLVYLSIKFIGRLKNGQVQVGLMHRGFLTIVR